MTFSICLRLKVRFSLYLMLGLLVSVSLRAASPGRASSAVRIAPGDTPLNLVETPDGLLISTNSGYGAEYLQDYDEARQQVSDRLELPSLWYGLDYEPTQKLLLASAGSHSVFSVPLADGKFGKPREIVLDGCELTAGVAFLNQSTALVACDQNHQVLKINLNRGTVLARATVGEYPYAVKVLPGGRVAVSNWGQASISVLDRSDLKILQTIQVGSHPSDMLVLPERNQLLVACSDSDLISIIDLESLREIRRVNIQIPGSPLGGAQPDALAFDPATERLFVALAAVNALAVFEVGKDEDAEARFQGLIPVGSYPTALLYSSRARELFIADGRNPVAGASSPKSDIYKNSVVLRGYKSDSGSPLAYIGYLVGGGIETISDSNFNAMRARMLTLAQQIYGAKQEQTSKQARKLIQYFSAKTNPHNPIRHVIYVIKENRTYDQVFGDMRQGNGAPDLVLFGEAITPNQHALARKFVLFDNFYVDGDVSYDGHLWSTTGSATDYANKLWPSEYSGHIKFDLWGSDYNGDDTHDHPVAAPASGFIWDLAQSAGVTYRDYGELCDDDKAHPGMVKANLGGLKGHYDPYYPDAIGEVSDQKRLDEWEREFREFEKTGQLPQLTIMHLPNDHTEGTKVGVLTPRAMVADNDLAVGRLVDVVSHSRFWPSTAIFVLEDDAQDGPDHVDAHRSPLLVISPYVRRGAVEHDHFSTVSVLKTIEQILGLGSLTYFDDRAPSLLLGFEKQPVLDTYTSLRPQVQLDEMNPPDAPGAKESAAWDFSHPDRAPEQALNRVIWQSVKGRGSEPPAPMFNVQSATSSAQGLGTRD